MTDQKEVSPENRRRAQLLAQEAAMSTDGPYVMQLATEALELDPRCTDAMLIVTRCQLDHEDVINSLEGIVEMAYEDLGGEDYLEQHMGQFWELPETQPYMRARSFLAMEYEDAGYFQKAIAEAEEMLKLNPTDHQAMRHTLLTCYLELDDFDGVRYLLEELGVDREAVMAWAHVLERFADGDEESAYFALNIARSLNPYFEDYANGSDPLPPEPMGLHQKGEPSEALMIASVIGGAWLDQPGLVEWIAAHSVTDPYIAPPKTSRNDPCPCGSGKKYKKCCLGKQGESV